MIGKKEVVRLSHYTNHIFNRLTKQLFKDGRSRYSEILPIEGVFTISYQGKQHNLTEEELMRSTQFVETDNIRVTKHYEKHEKIKGWS